MSNKEIDDLLGDDEPIEEVELNLDVVKKNVPTYSSQKLCDMIVCDRYFGFNQTITIMCMEELATRRIGGDTFEFEKYIDEAFKALPPLNFDLPDIRKVMQQAIGSRKNKK